MKPTGPIANFLDKVDRILNSNTFLLSFDVSSKDRSQAIRSFIYSDSFVTQIVQHDIDREWYNLHYYDEYVKTYQVRKGTLVKGECELQLSKALPNKLLYLVAMLTGDVSYGKFFSFYQQQLEYEEAKELTSAFIEFLFKGESWELYTLEPNFLTNVEEVHSPDGIFYFEQGDGRMSAVPRFAGKRLFNITANYITVRLVVRAKSLTTFRSRKPPDGACKEPRARLAPDG